MENFIMECLNWLLGLGYPGIALALMIEIIPSELVLAYGGYMVSNGTIHFTGAVIAGTVGGTFAQLFLYWIGRYGGRSFLERYGKYLLISQKSLKLAEEWFDRNGISIIFTARFIPVVRHAISIPAGIAKMSLVRFTLYTAIAMIPWSILFLYIGFKLGRNWQHIHSVARLYTLPLSIGAVFFISCYCLLLYMKKRKSR
ncbi:DedA family protein [Guptibacillus hwajinpoensis]|uniref:Membrane protein DedA with SNARE-associated domain n=1 Tax=Guptibacillus hwajinpoensis TaxID=208199 RepID=A0ABU0K572_9BACL|nr:DedA family protein [Alkalihalobacillus hemicentroti]MDQ0484489.1 membrane protein DedA with SNARE-associated domain [Alkalihalobacillus hemicentroti]